MLFVMVGGFLVFVYVVDDVKIGFLVKQFEELWFQDEWKFVDQVVKEKGFKLVKIGVLSGGEVLIVIDNLGVQYVQGFVICVFDVKLGLVVVVKVKQNNFKLMMVDDCLVDGVGKLIELVLYMGIFVMKIGEQVGDVIVQEMKKCGWNLLEVGVICIVYDQLLIVKECIDGVVVVFIKVGFFVVNVLISLQVKMDIEVVFNVVNIILIKNLKFKYWIVFGLNDEVVFGVVCVVEGYGVKLVDIIGVGIGGSQLVFNEFVKFEKIGFFGIVLISLKCYGYEILVNMYEWIKNNKVLDLFILISGCLMMCDNEKVVC